MLFAQKLVGVKLLPTKEKSEKKQSDNKQQGCGDFDKHVKILTSLGILKSSLLFELTLLLQLHRSPLLLFLYILLNLKADLSD